MAIIEGAVRATWTEIVSLAEQLDVLAADGTLPGDGVLCLARLVLQFQRELARGPIRGREAARPRAVPRRIDPPRVGGPGLARAGELDATAGSEAVAQGRSQ
jgi:hypothetical protein